MNSHSYENELNLHANEISFSYERMSTKTCFEKDWLKVIGHFRITSGLILEASLGAHLLYANQFSFI